MVVAAVLCQLLLASSAAGSDRELLGAVRALLPRAEQAGAAAQGAAANANTVQRQYDTARDLQEALRAAEPVSRSCAPLLRAALNYARGEVLQAEGFDRPSVAIRAAGVKRAAAARAAVEKARPRCRPAIAPASRPVPELVAPRTGEAFYGDVEATVPAGASGAILLLDGTERERATVTSTRISFRLTAPPGGYDLRVRFLAGGREVGTAQSRGVWLLPASAKRSTPERATDRALAIKLEALGQSFAGKAGLWVHDLASGLTAGWNADARFPAASTVKLGLLVAALQRFGPAPEDSRVAYDLRALAGWSSNVATNRLLVALGGSEAAGSRIAQATLRRLGARSSTFTGSYQPGTRIAFPFLDAPDPPPLVSPRVTTAHDLGRILAVLHAAAIGNGTALARSGLSIHEARVGLAMLLSSQATGDNVGLFRPALGPAFPMAQKHGWLSSVRHSAAILYGADGPTIVVLLTYRPALTRAQATRLGTRLIRLVNP